MLLAILVMGSLSQLTESKEELFLREAEVAKKLFATMVTDPVISYDLATLDSFVANALKNSVVTYVRVRRPTGEVLSEAGKLPPSNEPFEPTGTLDAARVKGRFDVAHVMEIEGMVVGKIEMGLSLANTEASIASAKSWLFTVSALEVILVALFSILLGTMLTRKICEIREAASAVAEGNYGVRLNEVGSDEMAELSRDFNKMASSLEQHEEQLESSRLAAERAREKAVLESAAKGKFLALMSHEVRTPLNAILGFSSSLLDKKLPKETLKAIKTIHDQGDNLLRILNDILDYSKLDSEMMEVSKSPFSPTKLTYRAVNLARPLAEEKGIRFNYSAEPCIPEYLAGDEGRIQQILLNLLSNAVKFTDVGSVSVHVRCLSDDGTRARLEWSITDTGIGIPEHLQKKLFTEFSQADPLISQSHGGTGLGLAICKKLADLMNGTISIRSRAGEGSIVRVSLEFDICSVPDTKGDEPETKAELLADAISHLGRPLKMLAVDDNKVNLNLVEEVLSQFPIELDCAQSGEECLELTDHKHYDFILMDVRMPGVDGYAATRSIRSGSGPNSSTPIVALTANAFEDDVIEAQETGMSDFLAKPMRKHELYAVVSNVIGKDAACLRRCKSADESRPNSSFGQEHSQRDQDAIGEGEAVDPLLDHEQYNDTLGDLNLDSKKALLDVFFEETQQRIDQMQELSPTSDKERIRLEAHTISGSAASFGASRLSSIARNIEECAETIDLKEYERLNGALVECFEGTSNAFQIEFEAAFQQLLETA